MKRSLTSHRIFMANNLPNKDFSGPGSGVSDPMVRFQAGDIELNSSIVRNSLNPQWHREAVSLGFLLSATEIKVDIFDHDIGVELEDDLMVSGSIRVPHCSAFSANYSTETCDTVFGCKAHDSLWQSPTPVSYTHLTLPTICSV